MIGTAEDEVLILLNEVAESEKFTKFEINFDGKSPKWDGCLSDIRCVTIIGEKRSENGELINDVLSLVCKTAFPETKEANQLDLDTFFEREILFYSEIAPKFLKFQRERGLREDELFRAFPKCYKAIANVEKGYSVIILENLKSKSYQLWPKNKAHNLEGVRRIVLELAKLHAISFAMKDQCPEELKPYERFENVWPENCKGPFMEICRQTYRWLMTIIEDEDQKRCYEHLTKFLKEYLLSSCDHSVPLKMRVLAHGDVWTNNLLMKLNSVDSFRL